MAKTNPLDQYLTTQPGSWPLDFRVPAMPKLSALVGKGVMTAEHAQAHDQAMEQWRKNFEQSISERIRQSPSTTTVQQVTQTVTVPAPAPEPVPPVDLSGIEADIAALEIAVAPANWLYLFDHYGFHTNDIPLGDSVYIPANRNLVFYGTLTVEGVLQVDGHLANLVV